MSQRFEIPTLYIEGVTDPSEELRGSSGDLQTVKSMQEADAKRYELTNKQLHAVEIVDNNQTADDTRDLAELKRSVDERFSSFETEKRRLDEEKKLGKRIDDSLQDKLTGLTNTPGSIWQDLTGYTEARNEDIRQTRGLHNSRMQNNGIVDLTLKLTDTKVENAKIVYEKALKLERQGNHAEATRLLRSIDATLESQVDDVQEQTYVNPEQMQNYAKQQRQVADLQETASGQTDIAYEVIKTIRESIKIGLTVGGKKDTAGISCFIGNTLSAVEQIVVGGKPVDEAAKDWLKANAIDGLDISILVGAKKLGLSASANPYIAKPVEAVTAVLLQKLASDGAVDEDTLIDILGNAVHIRGGGPLFSKVAELFVKTAIAESKEEGINVIGDGGRTIKTLVKEVAE